MWHRALHSIAKSLTLHVELLHLRSDALSFLKKEHFLANPFKIIFMLSQKVNEPGYEHTGQVINTAM